MTLSRSIGPTPEQSLEWIQLRKSTYPVQFEPGHTISVETLQAIFEAARYAPTHKLTQPWRFKAFIAEGKDAWVNLVLPAAREAWQAKHAGVDLKLKSDKLIAKAAQSAAIVAISMKRDPLESVPLAEEICAVACAVQNVALHMESMGWSGYWSTGAACNSTPVRRSLGLNGEDLHLGWYFIGKPLSRSARGKRMEVGAFLEVVGA